MSSRWKTAALAAAVTTLFAFGPHGAGAAELKDPAPVASAAQQERPVAQPGKPAAETAKKQAKERMDHASGAKSASDAELGRHSHLDPKKEHPR